MTSLTTRTTNTVGRPRGPGTVPGSLRDGRRQSVRAVEIGARVLVALGRVGGEATLSELAAAMELPASKTHRYLRALLTTGFAEQDAAGRYQLGVESLRLGLAALARIDVVAVATAPLASLCAAVNQTVLLSIWANDGATVVQVKEPPRRVTVIARIGSVLPVRSSASGLALAAYLPEAASAGTRGASKQSAREFDRRLRAVRAHGVAAVHGLFFPGIDALAAPVFGADGRPQAVLTVLGPGGSFDASTDGATARHLMATSAAIGARLGHHAPQRAKTARTRSRSS
jgi:DNA-binding IclR family transcriptional regulator